MRVLQIVANIGIKSGVSSFIMNVYRNIDREKIQFDFLVARKVNKNYEREISQLGGRIYYMPDPLSFRLFSACSFCSKFFSKYSATYSVVHLHSPTMSMMTIPFAKKARIPKIIIHSHSTQFSTNVFKRGINSILVSRIKNYGTDFWCCSPEAGNFLFGDVNSVWIPNAIDIDRFKYCQEKREEIRQRLNIKTNQKVICHNSNFSPLKNTNFLVPIIRNISAIQPHRWKFIFVGDGPQRSKLENEIKKQGLEDNCIFVGFQSDPVPYLCASDIFVLPSLAEGAPVSLLEAQACGLQCLVADTITRSVDLTGVIYLPLKHQNWVQEILKKEMLPAKDRFRANNTVSKSPYNICYQVKQIMELYEEK